MMLSRHFSLAEMIASQTATRRKIDNTPNAEQLENLKDTCRQADAVREYLGFPMLVSSGFRSPKLNTAIGGSRTSSHVRGEAMDFSCPAFGSPKAVFEHLKDSGISFDQMILEFPDSPSGGWVHIGFGSEMRNQKLVYDGFQYRIA
jgi:zinc D-Ala-D-Ala carboxypeptidase